MSPSSGHLLTCYMLHMHPPTSNQAQEREVNLIFQVSPFAISPILGTPQSEIIRNSGLIQFDDPTIWGGLWTASSNTKHLTYEQVSDWQFRLASVGDSKNLQVPQRFRTLSTGARNKTAVAV